jgi:hypothetical protein
MCQTAEQTLKQGVESIRIYEENRIETKREIYGRILILALHVGSRKFWLFKDYAQGRCLEAKFGR